MNAIKPPVVIRNRYFLASDLLLTILAALLGFAIRLDVPLFWSYLPVCLRFVLLAILIKLPVYYLLGLYRRYWRYASVHEMLLIVGAVSSASVLLALAVYLGILLPPGEFQGFPRSALVIDWLFSLFFVGGIRFSLRFLVELGPLRESVGAPNGHGRPRRVLIMGAGEAGAMIVRELRNNPGVGMEPVGYVDDNHAKQGMHIRGLPVLGTRESIPDLVRRFRVNEVLIAMPTAPGRAIREIKAICESVPVAFKTVPGMYELLSGTVQVSQIRDVQIEDLLRRDPVRVQAGNAAYLRDRVVLVTGAGGSIGSELCRQVAQRGPRRLLLLGHGEHSIYQIHQELRQHFSELELVPLIADVRDCARLQKVFRRHEPQVIFHAAAHKHVPLMELNVDEAITNNVLGTRNLLQVAEAAGVQRFVLISSDKAVNPRNIMGATKRIAEIMVQDTARRTGRNFVAVRFGNVLGSRGSVVPLFRRQIALGGPVTVTHPDMTRYFMTIPEAAHLVLQAAALGSGGELFVLDMGEPVKIVDLARDLITLSGLQPGRDIEIKFTGIRPGEKLHEELFMPGEDYDTTAHEQIFVTITAPIWARATLSDAIERLIGTAQCASSADEIWAAIRAIVPDAVDQAENEDPLVHRHPAPRLGRQAQSSVGP